MLKRMKGFTLPEIMVSVLLGTFIMAISIQVFQNSDRATSITRETNSMVNEATNTLNLFGTSVEQAGFFMNLSFLASLDSFPAVTGLYQDGQVVSLLQDAEGNSQLRFRLQGSDDIPNFDCLGNQIAAGTNVSMRVEVTDADGDGNTEELVCYNEGAPTDQVVWARNVDSMLLRLGQGSPVNKVVEEWIVTGPLVSSATSQIFAVELDIILKSEAPILLENKAVSFTRIDGTTDPFNDRIIRRQFTGVYSISNRAASG